MSSRRRPSSPHPRGTTLPPEDLESALQRAATAIAGADALLIFTGAGMGVDCGFGTFRGTNAGVWGPSRALCMDYQQMVDPDWFESDPRLAWAFWQNCYRTYSHATPHAGYDLLRKWGNAAKLGLFSVTTNVDGHWERTVGSEHIYEAHGAVTHLQRIVDPDSNGPVWRADETELCSLRVPTWNLIPGEAVQMRVAEGSEWGPWTPACVGKDGFSMVDEAGERVVAHGVRREDGPDLLRVDSSSALPCCGTTGVLARPNVLMFGDPNLNYSRIERQEASFNAWKSKLPCDVRLAVIEIGAGKAIPTMRDMAEEELSAFPGASLVRINLDDSGVGMRFVGRAVSIGGLSALEALKNIDALLATTPGKSSEEQNQMV